MKNCFKIILCIWCMGLPVCSLWAQQMPERAAVRKGNRLYNRGNYAGSIERYEAALRSDSTSFEALYDLGNAYYKSERYADAEQYLGRAVQRIAADSTYTDADRADALYNLGNVQFQQQKLKEALDCYKGALLLRPDDAETKYNYFYTKQLLKQQENQDRQDQQQDQQQQQQDQQQQDQQDRNQQEQNQQQEQQEQEQQNQQPEQDQQQLSDQEQQQMLEAIQAQEDRTQEKLKEKRAIVIRGGKNW